MQNDNINAPETVEAQARWERAKGKDVGVWVHVGCETDHEEWVPPALEAAIRAPLEERIRELEAAHVDRLREALERIELNSPVNSFAYKKAQEALATSSIEKEDLNTPN